jgi:polysaccharide export outer membrane protein
MHSQKWGLRNRAILVLTLLVLMGSWLGAASEQSSTNSAGVAKPVLPDSADPAKSGPPAAPDTTPPRVADVHPEGFVIGVEDVLNINVWKEPELSRVIPVRPDGMITLPLIGEIKAKGLTPIELQDQIAASLRKLMSDPQVTVIVAEVRSLTFNVVGQVLRPGYYPLTRRMTVLDAIALSGGFQPFAKQKKVYVLRTQADGKQVKLSFNYKDVIKGSRPDENIELLPRDTVVVP